jgi:hypothetical protein
VVLNRNAVVWLAYLGREASGRGMGVKISLRRRRGEQQSPVNNAHYIEERRARKEEEVRSAVYWTISPGDYPPSKVPEDMIRYTLIFINNSPE